MQVDRRDERDGEDWIDEILADSFPASDPPPWTTGIATLESPVTTLPRFEPVDLDGERVD